MTAARQFFGKLHRILSEAGVRDNITITFSIGVVTFLDSPVSADEMIKTVDAVMYAAKESGKNLVKYHTVGSHVSGLQADFAL